MDNQISPRLHVFICEQCTNSSQGKIEAGEAKKFRKEVKELALKTWTKSDIRVNGSSCLGRCETGISCVFYPQGGWCPSLSVADHSFVLSKIKHELEGADSEV